MDGEINTAADGVKGEHWATFVLSTGRCGTQWLAWLMSQAYGPAGRVEHEPLHNGYRPRLMLSAGGPEGLPPADRARIEAHLAGVERILETRDYFEAGHPCWSALPHLLQRFYGRIRVIHLTRHPVPSAYSWLSHGAYASPLLPHLPEKIMLHPADAGVAFPEYADRWPGLHPFERNLYYWTEVQAFALRLAPRVRAPWLTLRYEDMFTVGALLRLGAFLRLAIPPELTRGTAEMVDQHHFLVADWIEPAAIDRHPRVKEIAQELGYNPLGFDRAALLRRYAPGRA